ncbi:MAG TPA: hypothetical protein DDX26_02650 [Candidatus Yonathbacteria bacterium]|nr:MAG: cation transporter [Patescibacteria group bacterium]HBH71737.1 hypothetical protein [Candidatus Yonathbacteria bacterium]
MVQTNHLEACPSVRSGVSKDCSCDKEVKHYLKLAKLSFSLFIFELLGGIFSGSMALVSDALHVLLDGMENIVSAIVSRLSLKGYDEKIVRDFGGKISALLLLFASSGIVYEGFERILTPHEVEWYMVLVAIIGLAVNLWQKSLHNEALEEHRNQTHFWQNRHLISDISASAAVVIGGLVMFFAEGLYWIDGVLSVGIGVMIVFFTIAKLLGFDIHKHDYEHTCGSKSCR